MEGQQLYILIGIAVVAVIAIAFFVLKNKKTPKTAMASSLIDLDTLFKCLGGKENVVSVNASGSKVIFFLTDTTCVDGDGLKGLGASGIVGAKDKVTVIFGKISEALVKEIEQVIV